LERVNSVITLTDGLDEQNPACPFHPAKELFWTSPEGQCSALHIRLKDGLDYLSLNLSVEGSIRPKIEFGNDKLILGCVKSGWCKIETEFNNIEKLEPAQWFQFSGSELLIDRTSENSIQFDLFLCSREMAKWLLELDPDKKNQSLLKYADKNNVVPFSSLQMSDPALIAANKIDPTSAHHIKNRLQLEGHVLSWMAEVLWDSSHIDSPANNTINNRDKDAIRGIAQQFKDDPSREYSLAELCAFSGLNEHKLKNGFKSIYGQTTFTFLRKSRMEYAATLLIEDRLSVIQVANEVGYSNASHFARSFKEQHGLLPKAYQCLYRG